MEDLFTSYAAKHVIGQKVSIVASAVAGGVAHTHTHTTSISLCLSLSGTGAHL